MHTYFFKYSIHKGETGVELKKGFFVTVNENAWDAHLSLVKIIEEKLEEGCGYLITKFERVE
jgi:hypothetical protein